MIKDKDITTNERWKKLFDTNKNPCFEIPLNQVVLTGNGFEEELNEKPNSWDCRQIYKDWLLEQYELNPEGQIISTSAEYRWISLEDYAYGQEWLAKNHKAPLYDWIDINHSGLLKETSKYWIWRRAYYRRCKTGCRLPHNVFMSLRKGLVYSLKEILENKQYFILYSSRIDAEIELAYVIKTLKKLELL